MRENLSHRVMCKIGVAVVAVVAGHFRDFEGPEAPFYVLRCPQSAVAACLILRRALRSLSTPDNICVSLNDEGDLRALAHNATSRNLPVPSPCMSSRSSFEAYMRLTVQATAR